MALDVGAKLRGGGGVRLSNLLFNFALNLFNFVLKPSKVSSSASLNLLRKCLTHSEIMLFIFAAKPGKVSSSASLNNLLSKFLTHQS